MPAWTSLSIEREPGPSWARPNWPLAELDELNLGLDPTQATIEKVAAAVEGAGRGGRRRPGRGPPRRRRFSIRAMMLIRTYRVRGHLAAKLDPLGLTQQRAAGRPDARPITASPTPTSTGRSGIGGALGFEQATRARDRRACCRPTTAAPSASNICTSTTSRSGASSRSGSRARTPRSSSRPRASSRSSTKVIHAEQWEKFLARKYVGTKRFGLDGGESAVPALEAVIKYGGQYGRRPRSTSAWPTAAGSTSSSNVMGKPVPRDLPRIRRRRDQPGRRRRLGRRQISPRHLVATASSTATRSICRCCPTRRTSKRSIRSCSARRARCMTIKGDKHGKTVLPILLHGDAAFAGQGVVANASASPACPATAPAARSTSSSTTRSASPPARSSRARRPTRRTSPRGSRRRSSTSTATIPKR